jgi:Uma2 family endonuclease
MLSPELTTAVATERPVRPLSADDYQRMADVGIIDEDEHVELLEGVLVAMTPQSPAHAGIITELTRWFARALPDAYRVRVQSPVRASDLSVPEPDLAIVSVEESRKPESHPRSALLIIEVAHSTLRMDRGVKVAIYAAMGVPEYWIVNTADEVVEVYRDVSQQTARYQSVSTFKKGQMLKPSAVAGPEIPISDLFS